MSSTLVVFIHLFILFFVCVVVAIISGIITHYASRKKRNQKVSIAITSPFIMLYTFYFALLLGSELVSNAKDVDPGIGDYWHVPIINDYDLCFIDVPELGDIRLNGKTTVSGVAMIQQRDHYIWGKTYSSNFFLLDTETNELNYFEEEKDLDHIDLAASEEMETAYDFYYKKRDALVGTSMTVVMIVALILATLLTYLIGKLILNKSIKEGDETGDKR